jgi:predicted transcriptional regulator
LLAQIERKNHAVQNIATAFDETPNFVRIVLYKLVDKGVIVVDKTGKPINFGYITTA